MKKKIQEKDGAALVIAMVILTVVMMLSLALILVARSLHSSVIKQRYMEQCKEVAQGVSNEIEKELTSVKILKSEEDGFQKVLDMAAEQKNELWLFLRCNLWQSSWPYYNTDERGHSMQFAVREFPMELAGAADETAAELLKNTTVSIYWESETGAAKEAGTEVTVKVTSKLHGEQSTITTVYELKIEPFNEGKDYSTEAMSVLRSYYLDPTRTVVNAGENWEFEFEDRR